jgi:hypothetical protein
MEISIQLDKKIRKTVPLKADIQGTIAAGFELVSQSLSPSQVTIEGPKSVLDTVSGLSTDAVDLEGKNESFTVTAHILNPKPLIVIRGNGTAEFQALIRPLSPTALPPEALSPTASPAADSGDSPRPDEIGEMNGMNEENRDSPVEPRPE